LASSTVSSKQREAGLAPIAARSRDEKVQRNRATFYWKPRTIIACFSELDATPCAPFCERPVQLAPGLLSDGFALAGSDAALSAIY
jgi:hypothetical protein